MANREAFAAGLAPRLGLSQGDGKTDDTAALQAAFLASRTVFIPFGLYVVSDTLTVRLRPWRGASCSYRHSSPPHAAALQLRPDSRIVGEGLSVLWLAENAPGFSGPGLKTLLRVPENATSEVHSSRAGDVGGDHCAPHPLVPSPALPQVWLADITLWSTYCNATGARMLEWGAGPASGIWDVNMLLAMPVGLKLAVSGTGGAGAGYLSNTWFPATPNYVAAGRTVDAALRAIGPASAPSSSAAPLLHGGAGEPACSPNMPTGLNVTSVRGGVRWRAGATAPFLTPAPRRPCSAAPSSGSARTWSTRRPLSTASSPAHRTTSSSRRRRRRPRRGSW